MFKSDFQLRDAINTGIAITIRHTDAVAVSGDVLKFSSLILQQSLKLTVVGC